MGTFDEAVDAYSAPSMFCMERMAKAGIPLDKIMVRPNFLVKDPGPRSGSDDYAVFVGRLCVEKGVWQLLEAWRRLSGIRLVIVGDGRLRSEAERSASSKGGCWSAFDRRNDGLTKAGRSLVFPSIGYETFGLTVLEAAACGVATVGSRIGATPEFVQEGKTGLMFDLEDLDDLADKAEWAWTHPICMNEMGAEARRRSVRHYSAEAGYQELMKL